MPVPKTFFGPKLNLSTKNQQAGLLSPRDFSPLNTTIDCKSARYEDPGKAAFASTVETNRATARSPEGKKSSMNDFYIKYQKKREQIKQKRANGKSLSTAQLL